MQCYNFKKKLKRFREKKGQKKRTYTCNAPCSTNKEILNISLDKIVNKVLATWDQKELQEGKFNVMHTKSLHFSSDIPFWSSWPSIFNTSKKYN